MNTTEESPNPDDSSSAGTQIIADAKTELLKPSAPFEDMPMVLEMQGLTGYHARNFGGVVPAGLLRAFTDQIGLEITELRKLNKELRANLELMQEDLVNIRLENVVLKSLLSR